MIVLAFALAGFALGWMRAGRVGGVRADRWQWALGHAIALGLIGVFIAVFVLRGA
ncbi:MAG: hypothetical protein Q4G36_05370 [Paracoccus sp. (in: a-proteobacteria)]|nr:hypothetical protein [Paracoccus sp. (in: a-proteobacteria)]